MAMSTGPIHVSVCSDWFSQWFSSSHLPDWWPPSQCWWPLIGVCVQSQGRIRRLTALEKFWLRNIFEFVRSDCWIRFRLIWFTIGRERIWFIINKSWQVLEGIRHKTRYRLYTIQEAKGRAASPLCSGKDGLETENNVLWFWLPGWPMTTIADDLSHKPGCQKTQGCPPVLSAPGWKKICCCYGGNWSRIQRRKDWY